MALRVGFNAIPLRAPRTGIANYILNLGAALAASGEADLVSFYGHGWRHAPPSPPAGGVRGPLAQRVRDGVKLVVPFRRRLRHAQQQLTFGRGLRRHAIDLYHEPNYVPFEADVPVVTTIHDLSWLRYPQTHPADRVRWLERGMPRAIGSAAAIIVDSEFTRQEVLSEFAVPPGRVRVTHLGVTPEFRPRSAADTASALSRLDLAHGRYLLTVATIEPRKNLGHVLEAYAALPADVRERYALVVAGAQGWRAAALRRQLRALAASGRLRFVGHVADDALPSLYAGAALFVYPSLYEGFGLPPLEAMAAGVPLLVSDRASLPEIAGDAAVLLDPDRPERTAESIRSLLDDAEARAAMIERGLRRAAQFTWQACASATLDVYRDALQAQRR